MLRTHAKSIKKELIYTHHPLNRTEIKNPQKVLRETFVYIIPNIQEKQQKKTYSDPILSHPFTPVG